MGLSNRPVPGWEVWQPPSGRENSQSSSTQRQGFQRDTVHMDTSPGNQKPIQNVRQGNRARSTFCFRGSTAIRAVTFYKDSENSEGLDELFQQQIPDAL